MENLQQWGETLREWRERHHMSRVKLARKLEINESTVKRWEEGQYRPFTHNLQLLADLGFHEKLPQVKGSEIMTQKKPNEHPSTYFVEDRSNKEEANRLIFQDKVTTDAMGGALPEVEHPETLQRILDVGCGTGGWLIEIAKAYPSIEVLVGIDISHTMLDYARSQAEAAGVSQRIEWLQMDALRMLEFPEKYFSLVNLRYGQSFVRTWDWNKLLQEMKHVLKTDGIIRISDGIIGLQNEQFPAHSTIGRLIARAFQEAGRRVEQMEDMLPSLLKQHGFLEVQTRLLYPIFRSGTPEGQLAIEDCIRGYKTMLPFMKKWTQVPDNYEQIFQAFLRETQDPAFAILGFLVITWGIRP